MKKVKSGRQVLEGRVGRAVVGAVVVQAGAVATAAAVSQVEAEVSEAEAAAVDGK